MLQPVIGRKSDPPVLDAILAQLADRPWRGTLYFGYPVVPTARAPIAVDALLACREHGVVVFDVRRGAAGRDPTRVAVRQAALRQALQDAFAISGRFLVDGRPIVDIRVITIDPDAPAPVAGAAAGPESRGSARDPGGSSSPTGRPVAGSGAIGTHAPDAGLRSADEGYEGQRDVHTAARPRYGQRQIRPAPAATPAARTTGAGPARQVSISGAVTPLAEARAVVERGTNIDAASLRVVEQAVQRMGAVRPAPPAASIGALAGPRAGALADIERQIRTMDRWQKIAAIETPDGPQRIRGLAGSGKTVVLAHKAAYLHAREPTWRIAFTFHARPLGETLRALVRRFYVELTKQEPNWDLLHVRHAWGDKVRSGITKDVARHLGVSLTPGGSAAEKKYGKEKMFAGVCGEVLAAMGGGDPPPLYDAVLIDEAQDLPAAFFEMVYRVTRPPKRVVWAYDDLQNLREYDTASPATLFGADAMGRPRVPTLPRVEGEAQQDIILPVCYRNTPWALTTAHALGLGVYRRSPVGLARSGLIQWFEDPKLWGEIGYAVEDGRFAPGESVVLGRHRRGSPAYFERLLTPDDAVRCVEFASGEEEAAWVATEVARNLSEDGLTARDVLVVSANPFFRKDDGQMFLQALYRCGVRKAHVAGGPGHRDALFGDTASVAISQINLAKGGEAAMVYVVQAEHGAYEDRSVRLRVKRRNTLFAAITRSRAWVRISGSGDGMRIIREEVEQVVANGHRLRLVVPGPAELAQMRRLPRDMTQRQKKALVQAGRAGALALADLLRADPALLGETMRTLPPDDVDALRAALRSLDGRPDVEE